ncbi:VOC family protein [Nocardioides nanhaiensis]|uniref:VOC family protein n=1 Tax=Nocardioides nanhaiensis TaxID=1476871 RepID=A0ABP8W5L5_9ACTN
MTTPTGGPATATLKMTSFDCRDPRAAAAFWAALLGWQVAVAEDEYAMVVPGVEEPVGAALGFGRVADHEPAAWPDEGGRKQVHLDLACGDMEATEHRALELGAEVVTPQPGETWRVLRAPGGLLLCLTDVGRW